MRIARLVTIAAVALALSAPAFAQAPPNAALARVGYNSLKNRVKPDGELKIAIDAIDKEIAEAMRLGRTAEMRRQIAKGMALLNKRPWTDADDFDQSLILRSERQFVDSSLPYHVRLEQIFAPVMQLASPLTARATVRPLLAAPAGAGDLKPIADFSDVSRDLRDMPLHMELDLSAVPDGAYMLDVDVSDGAAKLGTASLRIAVQKGLESRLAALEKAALAAADNVRADIRYPADYLRKVNRGTMELSQFDLAKELAAAETIAAAANGGKDPFANRTGDFERHYLLEVAGEIMPYRVYVPSTYNPAKPAPLVVALHGLGGNEDGMMDNYAKRVPELAEKHGFIAVSPLGYRVDGFYGFSYGSDAASKRKQEFSEQDVMQVLARMRRDFKVDDSRIFLMGHSMGAIGTWFLAAKYPDIWAALGTFAGTGAPTSVVRMKHIPQFVVHGDNDPTVPVGGSRGMVAEMKTQEVDHVYIEVPGGGHSDVVVPNLAGMFEFFATKKKQNPTTRQ
ncbi:MAG TPA: PHB depolymerase family esterase [Vicinamibacterales bacterium]|nr:PHB depolymerase family esterase [Vicinamibacterales bacterium]